MSLRTRLLLAVSTTVLVALVLVATSTYVLVSRSQIGEVDDELDTVAPAIEQAAADDEDERPREVRELAPGYYVELRDESGDHLFVVALRDRDGSDLTLEGIEVPVPPDGDDAVFVSVAPDDDDDVLRVRVSRQDDGTALVIGKSLESLLKTRRQLLWALVATGLGAALAAVVLGAWLVRAGLRPLRDVERAAAEIGDDEFDRRVPGDVESTEVGQLARSINGMLERLEQAVEQREHDLVAVQESEARMRRFVADASHELRTPIAATAAYAELFERGARDRPDDLERAMAGIRSETSRMAELVDDLLVLARLDEGRPLADDEVDLCDVAAAAIDAARLVDPGRPVTVQCDDAVIVAGDAGRLRQIVDNLLANVRTHTPPGTPCAVTVAAEDGRAVLTVRDEGPGMSPSDASRAFDRFHRADASRTRASGGSGLGLAIVAAIAAAHGGEASLTSEPGAGTIVRIELPLGRARPNSPPDTPTGTTSRPGPEEST